MSTPLIIEEDRLRTPDGSHPLYSAEAFQILSRQWLRVGWALRYPYQFSWAGRGVIQFPPDLFRAAELIWDRRPDVIVETGVAHGGSLLFWATLCRAMGHGIAIGIERGLLPETRDALANHPLSHLLEVVEGDSVAPQTLAKVRQLMGTEMSSPARPARAKALVVLDSTHSRSHVRRELEAFAPLLAPASVMIACDGVMADLADVPRGRGDWVADNPAAAVDDFLAVNGAQWRRLRPPRTHDTSDVPFDVSHWPRGWVERVA